MKKLFSVLLLAFALSGCASMSQYLDTRVTCTVGKDEARADSKWGPIGLSTKVADADAKIICK